jgi:hypothetical protein
MSTYVAWHDHESISTSSKRRKLTRVIASEIRPFANWLLQPPHQRIALAFSSKQPKRAAFHTSRSSTEALAFSQCSLRKRLTARARPARNRKISDRVAGRLSYCRRRNHLVARPLRPRGRLRPESTEPPVPTSWFTVPAGRSCTYRL